MRNFRAESDVGGAMIAIGIIFLIIGIVAKMGIVFLLLGSIALLLGMTGHGIGGRRHYF
jgi:membrane-bound ClpP family serine protease